MEKSYVSWTEQRWHGECDTPSHGVAAPAEALRVIALSSTQVRRWSPLGGELRIC